MNIERVISNGYERNCECFVQNNYVKIHRYELSATVVMFHSTDDVVKAKNCRQWKNC